MNSYTPLFRIPKDYEKIYFEKNYNFVIEFIKEINKSGVEIDTIKQTEYFQVISQDWILLYMGGLIGMTI